MIYSIALYVAEELTRWEYPVAVSYGPDRINTDMREDYGGAVVFELDRQRGDVLEPPRGSSRSQRRQDIWQGVRVTIRGASPVEGARVADHEEEVLAYVDATIVAIEVAAKRAQTDAPRFLGGRMLPREESGGKEGWPGACYVLQCSLRRGIYQQTYTGQWRQTGIPTAASNTLNITED